MTVLGNSIEILGTAGDWVTIAQFWITVAVAITAIVTTIISVRLYSAQTSPQVIVYAHTYEDAPDIQMITIKNIGNGAAKDVIFECPPNFPFRAFGLGDDKSDHQVSEVDEGAFSTGIPFLEPGGTRTFMWGQYAGIKGVIGTEKLKIVSRYRNAETAPKKHGELSQTSYVDIESFSGTDASDNNPHRKAANALDEIAKAIDHSSSDFSPLHIAITDSRSKRTRRHMDSVRKKKTEQETADSDDAHA